MNRAEFVAQVSVPGTRGLRLSRSRRTRPGPETPDADPSVCQRSTVSEPLESSTDMSVPVHLCARFHQGRLSVNFPPPTRSSQTKSDFRDEKFCPYTNFKI